jgi:putative ubiquitin-RnfH superfamily antitoxin RatB of RatAB toxin-antitoxin module
MSSLSSEPKIYRELEVPLDNGSVIHLIQTSDYPGGLVTFQTEHSIINILLDDFKQNQFDNKIYDSKQIYLFMNVEDADRFYETLILDTKRLRREREEREERERKEREEREARDAKGISMEEYAAKKKEYLFSKDVRKYVKCGSKMKHYKLFMLSYASLDLIKHAMVILKQNNPRVYSKSSVSIEKYLTSVYKGRPDFTIRSMSSFTLICKK